MNDDNSVSGIHYVDAYQPPTDSGASANDASSTTSVSNPPNSQPNAGMSTNQSVGPQPPAHQQQPTQPQPSQPSENRAVSEALEEQNIFFLLGVNDGTAEQKEKFLDELQQVIWEDFLEYDVKLLITSEEQTQLQRMIKPNQEQTLDEQEQVVVFLEKLIPDLEEIMMEKALELKEDMVRERAAGLRTYYAEKPESIKRIDEAEKLMNQGSWYSAAHLMNSLA